VLLCVTQENQIFNVQPSSVKGKYADLIVYTVEVCQEWLKDTVTSQDTDPRNSRQYRSFAFKFQGYRFVYNMLGGVCYFLAGKGIN